MNQPNELQSLKLANAQNRLRVAAMTLVVKVMNGQKIEADETFLFCAAKEFGDIAREIDPRLWSIECVTTPDCCHPSESDYAPH
jgi:hypothetical protein